MRHISGKYTLSLIVLFTIGSTPPPSAAASKAGTEETISEDQIAVDDTTPLCSVSDSTASKAGTEATISDSTATSVATTSESQYVLL